MRCCHLVVLLFFATAFRADALEAERLFYLSNGQVLTGCLYKPKGKGPFPAIVFNHNSSKPWPAEGALDPFPELAKFCAKHGYVLFSPGRQKVKAEEAEGDADTSANESDSVEQQRKNLRIHEMEGEIVFAALEALKAQSYIDPERVFVIGQAGTSIVTLLLAEKDLNVRGYVLFSPASGVWKRNRILQEELKRAARNAKAPVFLIQPENDFSLAPAEILGGELQKKGPPNTVKIYPAFGKTSRASLQLAKLAPEIWGADVLTFFLQCGKH